MNPQVVLFTLEIFRFIEMLIGVVCLIVLVWRTVQHWRGLSQGQKLFHLGLECILLSALWDVYDLWVNDINFSGRGVPYTLGVLLLYVYILEPKRSYIKRLGIEPYENTQETEQPERKEDCE